MMPGDSKKCLKMKTQTRGKTRVIGTLRTMAMERSKRKKNKKSKKKKKTI